MEKSLIKKYIAFVVVVTVNKPATYFSPHQTTTNNFSFVWFA